ncbi:MAG: zinc-ribbon domain-containing protein [Bacilli bacterium]
MFCSKCGEKNKQSAKFCTNCGSKLGETDKSGVEKAKKIAEDTVNGVVEGLSNTNDLTHEYKSEDIISNKVFAILSYFGILVLVPILGAKESPFAKFHANQGLVLLIGWVGYLILYFILHLIKFTKTQYIFGAAYSVPYTPWFISFICLIISIPLFVFCIMGIVYASQGKAKELPIIGKLKLLK